MADNRAALQRDIAMYRRMRLVRRFEEWQPALIEAGEIIGHTHQYIGQEAVAVGVCQALNADDVVTSTHRGHGHVLAKGADAGRSFAELMGKETGYNKGRGGSMHLADLSLGIYGANGIVGAGAPMAVGAAATFKRRGESRVAVAFFGDGAINQGVLLESLNLAAVWRAPVIFVCENNQYAVTTAIRDVLAAPILGRAQSFGLPAEAVDGMDARAVFQATERAVERARSGGGASFLECATYRFEGHFTAERGKDFGYRGKDEVAEWRRRCPIERLGEQLLSEGGWTAAERQTQDSEVEAEIERALVFARASAYPPAGSAHDFMYARGYPETPALGWE